MSGWNGSSVGIRPVRNAELAVGQYQGRLVVVLPVEPRDDALVEFVANLESLDRRRCSVAASRSGLCGLGTGCEAIASADGETCVRGLAPPRRVRGLEPSAIAGPDRVDERRGRLDAV